ncbi:MAG TPA: hypothetical protein VGC66_23560 [Pyrinomonadaceae bacterium]
MSPRYSFKLREVLLMSAACLCLSIFSTGVMAQRANAGGTRKDEEPCFSEYKGIQIGMTIDEARKKLGAPKEKADELDIYSYNDKETAQVYYDKTTQKITAISVDYLGATDAPECKKVTGTEADSRADGSKFKLIRYPKQGYWVSYNRTAGASPIITVTMQKIQ